MLFTYLKFRTFQMSGFLVTTGLLFLSCGALRAQTTDTVRLSPVDAEKLFLQNNLDLLAQQYNIDISTAQVQQAKYWDNPVLNTDQNIYDGKFFRHNSDYGQVFIQVQQLIKTAGKRNKLIRLANDQVLTAKQQFNDLLRNLKYLLRSNLATLWQLQQTTIIYHTEINALQQLAKGMDAQLQAGNISEKDNLRIKALVYSLNSDMADLEQQINDLQKELHLLLRENRNRFIVSEMPDLKNTDTIDQLQPGILSDSARTIRPDAQLAQINIATQQHNLAYQQALAVPDVNVGVEYDQRSSYINNYYGLAISIPLPLFNRNKGNINASKLSVKQADVLNQQVQLQVDAEVIAAWRKLQTLHRLRKLDISGLQSDYDRLLRGVIDSYGKRQIGLLEFIDFLGSYKDARTKQLQQETNLRNAGEELNMAVGKDIIHLN